MKIGGMLDRLVGELKVPEALEFVTISSPMPWLFTILAENRRVSVLFRGFYLLEMNIKNFSCLPINIVEMTPKKIYRLPRNT